MSIVNLPADVNEDHCGGFYQKPGVSELAVKAAPGWRLSPTPVRQRPARAERAKRQQPERPSRRNFNRQLASPRLVLDHSKPTRRSSFDAWDILGHIAPG